MQSILIQIFNSYSEMECPLCFQYTLQVYLHLSLFFTLCKRCTQFANPRTRRLAYLFKTLLAFQPTRDNKHANKRLKSHILHSKSKITHENFQQMIEIVFRRDKPQKEDSESLTISTQESDISKDFLIKQQKAKFEAIKDKCHETVKSITKELEPMKQSYQKAKDKIYTSSINFKQKIVAAHQQYTNISAEMPPIAAITMDSLKHGFKGLSSYFF